MAASPDPTRDEVVFGYRYEPRCECPPRAKTTVWAGRFDTIEPEAGSTDLVRHVHDLSRELWRASYGTSVELISIDGDGLHTLADYPSRGNF